VTLHSSERTYSGELYRLTFEHVMLMWLYVDSRELVAMMCGHGSTIHAISVHDSGRYAMTTSTDMAQLWDLDSFQRKRKLTVKEDVPIVKVCFCCVY